MVNLNKEEYVYLMIVRTKKDSNIIDVDVHPFRSNKDIKHALLNVISNNAKIYKSSIKHIVYNDKAIVNTNIGSSARIEFNSGITKTYEAVCRHIETVK